MKKQLIPLLTLSLILGLSACGDSYVPDAPNSLEDKTEMEVDSSGHDHTPPTEDNIVEHEMAGYCGNTVTKVSRETRMGEEAWEVSFWGSDSVMLTDLLLYLDYSGEICRCTPEYNVDTEFGTGYGINLTEGYVRHDGGQVSLTAEQIETIQGIFDRQAEQSGTM